MSDSTITAVANGGSPQPVQNQAPSPTSKEAMDKIAVEVSGQEADEASGDDEAVIDAAEATGDLSPEEAKDLKKKLKLKVDGEEFEEEISWNDEEGLKRHLQKSKAFDKRGKEFASFKNQVDSLVDRLRNDPEALLEEMGYDVDKMAEKRLSKRVEDLSKSPEQLEKEKMQKELEDYKKKAKQADEEKQQAEMERLRNQQATQIQDEITEALDSTKSKLPKNNPFVVQKIAQNLIFAMKNGYPNVTVKDVIPIVEKQWQEELRSYFDTSPEDFIEEMVGKQNLDRLRKRRIQNKPKTQTARQAIQDTGNTNKSKEEPAKEKKSFKSMFSYHDE